MNKHITGWLWVALQAALLGALILIPGRDDWATPNLVRSIGLTFNVVGFAIIAIASLRLGWALTPTPVPNERGRITTNGLYRFMRHPIYTGVLSLVVGLTVRSGSLIHLAIAVGTVLFFDRKARWEEGQLSAHYPDYSDYAAHTPRFVPRPWTARNND